MPLSIHTSVDIVGKKTDAIEATIPYEVAGSSNIVRTNKLNGIAVGEWVLITFRINDHQRRISKVRHIQASEVLPSINLIEVGQPIDRADRATIANAFVELGNVVESLPCSFSAKTSDMIDAIEAGRFMFPVLEGFSSPDEAFSAAVNAASMGLNCSPRFKPLAPNKGVKLNFGQPNPPTSAPVDEDVDEQIELRKLDWVGNHFVPDAVRPYFRVAETMVQRDSYLTMLLKGPSGTGKTETARALATWLDLPYLRINCALVRDTESWFGEHTADAGSTRFEPSTFTQMLEAGNCVIVLDEINRIEPWIANSLFSVLDSERAVEVAGRKIQLGGGIIFVMTINEGFEYAGTQPIDKALLNRVDITEYLTHFPAAIERKIIGQVFPDLSNTHIKSIQSVVSKLRKAAESDQIPVDVSIRSCIKIARLIEAGLPVKNAFLSVIVNTAPADTTKSLVEIIDREFVNN